MQSITSAMSHSAAVRTRVHEVQGGVGRGPVRAALAAHQDDGHGAVLHHEAEDGPGVGHGVGAVADDDAVGALGDLLADGHGQGLVLLGPHVLAEDAEELLGVRLAMSASSGTAPYSSPGVKAGITAPVR